jgi:long-chain acyl-CoA synthetase
MPRLFCLTQSGAGKDFRPSVQEDVGSAPTLQELLRGLTRFGDAPAIVSYTSGAEQQLSFAALTERARKTAVLVTRRGLAPGATVGLFGSNRTEWIEAFWGIVAAGLVAMPIDAQIGDDDLRRMLLIGDCHLVFAATGHIERVHAVGPSCETIDFDVIATELNDDEAPHDRGMGVPREPRDVAVLVFTSGTTGPPKAVPLTHANVLSNVTALASERIIGAGDRLLLPLSLHHTYPLTVGMLTALACGATMILPAGISGPQLVEAMQSGRATILLGVPRLYTALLVHILAAAARGSRLRARLFAALVHLSYRVQRTLHVPMGPWPFAPLRQRVGGELRLLVCGGAALPAETEEALEGLGWHVLTGYGLTETSPIITFNRAWRSRLGSAGQPLPGVRVRIARPDEHGFGDIEVAGSSVFAGYRNDPDATRDAFTADGWLRTGDLGRLDTDGYLFVVARRTETIVLPSGMKIFPEPVEAAYAENPLIREIAVLAHNDKLVALIVPNEDEARKAGTIRFEGLIRDALEMRERTLPNHLRLAGFSVTRMPLPRTPLGKIQRHLLPALYARAAVPRPSEGEMPVAASDAALLEMSTARDVWRWLRDRYPDHHIGFDTSPQLDLGIDSLGWIDLTLALQQSFGIRLMEAQIARIVTVRDLMREALAAAGHPGADSPAESPARQQAWLEPYGIGVKALRLVGEIALRATMCCFFRLRVEGRENLPDPPFVLCPNHVSYLDPFAVAAALPHRHLRNAYWAGWTGLLFRSRLHRLFSRAAQVIPVDPDRAAASAITLAVSVLQHGHTLIWFPEGALSPDSTLQRFLPGIGVVLEARPAPVVPVRIRGGDRALPLARRFPRPHRIVVRFGTTIEPTRLVNAVAMHRRPQAIADIVHDAVAAMNASSSMPPE